MQAPLHITASCVINNNRFIKNEQLVFEKEHATIAEFLVSAYQYFGVKYPKFYKMDSLCKMGWLATELLLKDTFDKEKYQPEETGVVLSNASSSLDADIKYFDSVKEMASPALFVYTLPNIVIGEISIYHNFKGENAFFISETFDAEFLQLYVSNLFNNNILQACICGWVEVIGAEYMTALFLIEKEIHPQINQTVIPFTNENLNKIYQLHNG